jgi:restriction endonuclease
MDSPVDRVENASRTYATPDEVKPLTQPAPEKERKFAKALKEKMEDELEQRKKRHGKDEAIIDPEHPEKKNLKSKTTQTDETEDKQGQGDDIDEGDKKTPSAPGHIDLRG